MPESLKDFLVNLSSTDAREIYRWLIMDDIYAVDMIIDIVLPISDNPEA